MREELVRRNYAESTIRSYLHTIEDFRRYCQKRLDHLGPDDIRRYQVYLREERKLDIGTAVNYVADLRFMKEDMPYPNGAKHKRRLPVILSQEEVTPPDRLFQEPVPLRHAHGDVLGRTATERGLPAQGQ
jgi:site-specific recombinase XerD